MNKRWKEGREGGRRKEEGRKERRNEVKKEGIKLMNE
jgi:hypothetical protein